MAAIMLKCDADLEAAWTKCTATELEARQECDAKCMQARIDARTATMTIILEFGRAAAEIMASPEA